VDAKLSEQIESTIDALRLSHTRAELVRQTMRNLGVSFDLLYSYPDDDIAQLINKLSYVKSLAKHQERLGG